MGKHGILLIKQLSNKTRTPFHNPFAKWTAREKYLVWWYVFSRLSFGCNFNFFGSDSKRPAYWCTDPTLNWPVLLSYLVVSRWVSHYFDKLKRRRGRRDQNLIWKKHIITKLNIFLLLAILQKGCEKESSFCSIIVLYVNT